MGEMRLLILSSITNPKKAFSSAQWMQFCIAAEAPDQEKPKAIASIDEALKKQTEIATPEWVGGPTKDRKNPDGAAPGKPMLGALGNVLEKGDEMLVAYSVMNTTDHWIEVLPPQVELNSPNLEGKKKKDKKKHEILAEQIPVMDYRLNARRLAPGERADGAVQFARPGFKQSEDRLLLQLATASAVDTPALDADPFCGAGTDECLIQPHPKFSKYFHR